jgi:hypothetical protein
MFASSGQGIGNLILCLIVFVLNVDRSGAALVIRLLKRMSQIKPAYKHAMRARLIVQGGALSPA